MLRYLFIGILVLLVSSCSTFIPYVDIGAITDRKKYESVQFPSHLEAKQFEQIPNGEDPCDLVHFAMNLAENGEHGKAAIFLEEAAGFPSYNNQWAIACLTAAANEHLKAGNLAEFRSIMERLVPIQSRLQKAAPEELTETMLSVYQLTQPGQVDVNQIPTYLRDIVPK